jgi:maltose alpha-D-glucosyltransferase/alpha-amylase
MDFLLDHRESGYQSLVRDYQTDSAGRIIANNSYFKKEGGNNIRRFLDQYLPWYEAVKNDGFISLITGNHDTPRISYGLSPRELALAYGVFFTMPGVPFLYYGDEIGMRYLAGLPTKEGGYTRTGSRTPMQWKAGKNRGFSAAQPEQLYLPVDSDSAAPTVEAQEKDSTSLLNTVKALLRLRHAETDLHSRPNLEILHAPANSSDRSFIYRRGSCIVGVNPGAQTANVPLTVNGSAGPLYTIGGCAIENGSCRLEGQSFGVWKM